MVRRQWSREGSNQSSGTQVGRRDAPWERGRHEGRDRATWETLLVHLERGEGGREKERREEGKRRRGGEGRGEEGGRKEESRGGRVRGRRERRRKKGKERGKGEKERRGQSGER